MRLTTLLLLAALLSSVGCTTLKTPSSSAARSHLLEPETLPDAVAPGTATILALRPVRAGALLEGSRMQYRRGGVLATFADNRWSASPEVQLSRWLVAALERGAGLAAVVAPGDRARADLRLETELVALYQDFAVTPSVLRIELRAQLVAQPGNQVLATRRFSAAPPCPSDDPDGGVAGARAALTTLLAEVTRWVGASASPAETRETAR